MTSCIYKNISCKTSVCGRKRHRLLPRTMAPMSSAATKMMKRIVSKMSIAIKKENLYKIFRNQKVTSKM